MTPTLRRMPYDSAWPSRLTTEAGRLRPALGTAAQAIEHVGSTAVAGVRNDAALSVAYAAEKYRVAESVGWDKGAYSLAKGPFVQHVLANETGES